MEITGRKGMCFRMAGSELTLCQTLYLYTSFLILSIFQMRNFRRRATVHSFQPSTQSLGCLQHVNVRHNRKYEKSAGGPGERRWGCPVPGGKAWGLGAEGPVSRKSPVGGAEGLQALQGSCRISLSSFPAPHVLVTLPSLCF